MTYRRFALVRSVRFVSVLSVWALVEAAYAGWRSDEAEHLKRIEARLDEIAGRGSDDHT